jgi:hypothetical protein
MTMSAPGSTCTSRLGPHWIDGGTNTLTRMRPSTPLGMMSSMIFGALPVDPLEAKYNAEHVYSTAPEAVTKRRIDLQIIGNDYRRGSEISLDNEAYLKALVQLASGTPISNSLDGLQFFNIRGGAEGFLPPSMLHRDARRRPDTSSTTGGTTQATVFDHNDLLVVFDTDGSLISAARLERPISVPGWITESTANEVYDSWDGQDVFVYRNTYFEIPYLGLGVRDGFRYGTRTPSRWKKGAKGKTVIDMHKQEDTNGCIFIVDKATPGFSHLHHKKLDRFEPQLIKDVLAATGHTLASIGGGEVTLGVMHVIEIK